jgi:hypothetical protein
VGLVWAKSRPSGLSSTVSLLAVPYVCLWQALFWDLCLSVLLLYIVERDQQQSGSSLPLQPADVMAAASLDRIKVVRPCWYFCARSLICLLCASSF